MCFSRPSAPPPPPPITLPKAPQIPNIVAPLMTQAGPKAPRETPAENPLLMRRGKRGLVIPLASEKA
jgi:hypothetical protein